MRIQPVNCGVSASREIKDCTVRALANATDMDYEKAHALLAKHGRDSRKGALCSESHGAYLEAGLRLIGVFGCTARARFMAQYVPYAMPGISFGKLMPKLKEGRYVVIITGHALAVINGQVIDKSGSASGMSVVAVYKV